MNAITLNSQMEPLAAPGEFSSRANELRPWAEFKDFIGFGAASRDREFQHNEAVLQRNFQTNSMNIQHEYNKELMDYAEEKDRNKYKNAVEGLKEAGLNPTLALTMGNSAVSTPSTSAMSGASGKGSSAGTGSAIGLVQAITQLVGTMADKNTTINKYK